MEKLKHTTIIKMIKEGKSTKQIAEEYGVDRKYVNNVMTAARKDDPSVPKLKDITTTKTTKTVKRVEPRIYQLSTSGRFAVRDGRGQKSFDTIEEAREYRDQAIDQPVRQEKKKAPQLSYEELDTSAGYVLLISKDKELLTSILNSVRL